MKKKSIEFTPIQIEALENGATMFVVPICIPDGMKLDFIDYDIDDYCGWFIDKRDNSTAQVKFPIDKGDKDIYVKEEFLEVTYPSGKVYSIIYKGDNNEHFKDEIYQSASKMTKEQSRYSLSECIDVRVVRVRDITAKESWRIVGDIIPKEFLFNNGLMFYKYYNTQLEEQNINRTYDDNDYIFLIEVKTNVPCGTIGE